MRIAGSKIVDKKLVLAKDEAIQRQIALNLQRKFDPISKAMFREKQAEKYLNTLVVSNEPTLANLIADSRESALQNDSLQSFSLAKNNLLSVADEDTSNYILDRLDDAQINTLNQRFPEFVKVISKRYKNIDKNRFIEMVKSETFDYAENDITERGQMRMERDSGAEIRRKITEDRDEQLKGERGPDNVINREQYEDYPYGNKNVTPEKNPQKEKKEISPKQRKTLYGQLAGSYPSPQNEIEESALGEAERFSSSLRTKQEMANYIQTMIEGTVPVKYTKNELEVIVLNLKYRDEIENQQTEGYGMRKKIYGRGFQPKLSRNPEKFGLNNGKFTIDLGKLRRNILSVSYSSCRAVIPSLKKEHISNDVKNMITDIIEDKYNANLFNKMKQDDQRIISTFVRTTKQDIDMSEFDKAYQNHYEILLGQVNSGQNNPEIKRELKEYILRAITEGLIPKTQGLTKLFELSL